MKKVIYIQQHIKGTISHPPRDMYPNFITYGFGSKSAREFKRYNPEWNVECWRLDSTIKECIEDRIENVTYRIFPATGNRFTGIYSLQFLKEIRLLKSSTILNVQGIHLPLYYHILLIKNRSTVITAQHHGDFSPYFLIKRKNIIKKLIGLMYLMVEKIVINKTDFFFLIDVNHIPYLEKSYGKLGDDNYYLQPVGIETKLFKAIDKKEARRELGLEENKIYLFYLGKYYQFKEVDVLAEIFNEVRKINPDIILIAAGGTPEDIYYRNIVECGAIEMGRILNKELYKYYSAADAYVCCTFRDDYFGGVGIAMIEAMASNTPVISKSLENISKEERKYVGMMPCDKNEMVKNIIELTSSPEKFKDIKGVSKRLFDYKVIQNKTLNIYEKLIN